MSDADTKTRHALPKHLRADSIMKMPIGCRFFWHHWQWQEVRSCYQRARCLKCGKVKERTL